MAGDELDDHLGSLEQAVQQFKQAYNGYYEDSQPAIEGVSRSKLKKLEHGHRQATLHLLEGCPLVLCAPKAPEAQERFLLAAHRYADTSSTWHEGARSSLSPEKLVTADDIILWTRAIVYRRLVALRGSTAHASKRSPAELLYVPNHLQPHRAKLLGAIIEALTPYMPPDDQLWAPFVRTATAPEKK